MEPAKEFLILGTVLAVVWFLITLLIGYYFVQFKKMAAKQKIYGKGMLIASAVLSVLTLVAWIVIIVLYTTYIRDEYLDGKLDYTDSKIAVTVAMAVIGYVSFAALIVLEWFFLPMYGIAFVGEPGNGAIVFMGEQINYSQITKIVIDSKTRKIYINRRAGKRNFSRLALSQGNVFGMFIREYAYLSGFEPEELDEEQYFKELRQNGVSSANKK